MNPERYAPDLYDALLALVEQYGGERAAGWAGEAKATMTEIRAVLSDMRVTS